MDLEFSLELADPPLGGRAFRPLDGRQARDESSVDRFLASPRVGRLVADAEVAGQIGDPPPSGEEIKDASSELGWIPTYRPGLNGIDRTRFGISSDPAGLRIAMPSRGGNRARKGCRHTLRPMLGASR